MASKPCACACREAPLTGRRDLVTVIAPFVYERHGRDWCARFNRRIVEAELHGVRRGHTINRIEVSFYLLGKEELGHEMLR